MPKSAGVLCYRAKNDRIEFLLIHPGGPYFKTKDDGVWTIPKGLAEEDEELLEAAKREFMEETGLELAAELIELTPIQQKGGKWVYAWAMKGDLLDIAHFKSNYFQMEWPPKSGKIQLFPEADKIGWFAINEALQKINSAQANFITELLAIIK